MHCTDGVMMEEYPIQTIDNLIVATIKQRRVLIDTGSPYSLGDGRPFFFLGNQYNFPTSFMGLDVSQLNQFLSTKIDILLGGDVLSKIVFMIDCYKSIIQVSSTRLEFEGVSVPAALFMDIPIIDLRVGNRNIKAFLDTGSRLSYLDPEIIRNYNSIGSASDFYPGVGQFSTSLYEIPVVFADTTRKMTFGKLPELLQKKLMEAGTKSILGNEVFKYYKIYFCFQNKKIILKRVTDNHF
jgi:hypothetical protein